MRPELVERVRRRLAEEGTSVQPSAMAEAVRAEIGGVTTHGDMLRALRTVRQELVGLGPLEHLLSDPDVTDVLVSAPDQVWVDGHGGLRHSTVSFADEQAVRRLAQRLALTAGRRLDDAQPYVDGWLPQSCAQRPIRMHAVLPPVAADGTCLSLRVLHHTAYDLVELAERGTFDRPTKSLLEAIVTARLAFLVTGCTGSGKSTLLGALLAAVPAGERIVCVEDAGELRPGHPQFVRLLARQANVEGAGEITLRDLVRQALRMRPDRLVLGEVRGREVVDLLTALNTGHDGGACTVHANSPAEVPARLEALAALGGMDRDALHGQLAAAVQVVLHMRRRSDGGRALEDIGVLRRAGGGVEIVPAWRSGSWTEHRDLLTRALAHRGVGLT
ncbi:TadA family conjugal transfer-associated ATPase [Haloechinothrix sp. LS1_15]|uniref:TadA family conjugal transfer-associated ATPase n=1 Tax=Haloechinothrix sp. LS1_15 TaxID=2652248 RepID=UPI0029470235|nr:TadA family conjugal transfer-associated ATPase [Haloechinothrix sp. LS1_15]MDV6011358.1 TadA family conjugal transfer-associated ATPase [Haloechinothrix sp. LS1_15]